MEINIAETEQKEITSFFYRILIPRPIAWVSTRSKKGIDNLAPFSFYGGVSANPPIVSLGIGRRAGKHKDTSQNLLDTGECVIHLTSVELSEKMVKTSAELPPEKDEFEVAGLEKIKATDVKPPRLKDAKVAMEGKLYKHIEVGNSPGDMILVEIIRQRGMRMMVMRIQVGQPQILQPVDTTHMAYLWQIWIMMETWILL